MSTRFNNGSHYENHQRAAELHDGAAHAHRAAEKHGQQDHLTGHEHSRQALEHSTKAHEHSQKAAPFAHAEVAALANELWQARGCPEGSSEQDWFEASRQLRARIPGR